MADPRVKELKIKTGVVKRLVKERESYEKEAEQHATKVEKMKAEGGDEYVIRKAVEVLQETRQMVPDCTRRLQQAVDDLSRLTESSEKDLAETEEFQTARTQLTTAQAALKA
uniref:Tubulin-specific chaperone A n=1 Tax=Plectus sambesii TaxID=2011161 RepID=A0A914XCE2_9BILA